MSGRNGNSLVNLETFNQEQTTTIFVHPSLVNLSPRSPVPGERASVFSPTISHAATRVLLVDAAARSQYVGQYDVSNAFVQSVLSGEGDERAFVRLPKHWSPDPRGDVVKLLKSLYGLKIAPRRWYETYCTFLIESGWTRCESEPGLFRRNGVIIVVYHLS